MRVNGLVGVVAALALVVASCTSVGDAQPVDSSTTSSPVPTTTTSLVALSVGVPVGQGSDAVATGEYGSVLVPSDSVSGPGSLVVQTAVVEPPENMELLGDAFDVSLVDTELTGAVVFAVDSPPPPDGFPDDLPTTWLATLDASTGEWTPIETVLVGGKAVAEVDHFSLFGWIRPNLDWLGDTFNGLVQSVLGPGVFGVEQPVCDNEQLARDNGFEVTSDSGSSTFWCVGVEDGRTVLKVANNRRYSVGMNLPDGFTILARERSSGVVEALNPVADPAFGFDVTISRGEEVIMGVPAGGSGEIVVEPSPGTFLLDTLSIEIDFVASVFKVDSVAAAAALSGKCLVDNVPDLFSDDLQDAVSSAFSSTFGCMSDVFAETIVDGWLANMLWGFVSSTIRLVIEGLFGAVSGIVDSIRGIFDGSDFYNIAISSEPRAQEADLGSLTLLTEGISTWLIDISEYDEVVAGLSKRLGPPTRVDPAGELCWVDSEGQVFDCDQTQVAWENLTLAFDELYGGRLIGYAVREGPVNAMTPEGVRVGTTLSELVAAYPKAGLEGICDNYAYIAPDVADYVYGPSYVIYLDATSDLIRYIRAGSVGDPC